MKILSFIFILILINKSLLGNEIEVIELHENKSLDQMVLDQLDEEISNDEIAENLEVLDQSINNENIEQEIVLEEIVEKNSFWENLDSSELKNYFINLQNINSKLLQVEFYNFLENSNLDYEIKNNRDIFFQIINYFYNTGNISKSYNLLKLRNISNDENISFYYSIEINYLLSTFQLDEVCILRNEVSENIFVKNFLLDKIDIFCLVLQNKLTEAELLNSILLETENEIDVNFQNLYQKLTLVGNENNYEKISFEKKLNKDLIFLYGAMARIAELPLTEDFLEIDPKNLAIPIILNQASSVDLRIMAANESFNNKNISVESLAALYQSVDFNSNQLNNPDQTIKELENNIELLIAFYFQQINIQIFPSDRLNALINFWEFAKENNLEEIAYSLSYKITQSIEISADNLEYSPQISTSYIYNNDFEKALDWISFYENSKQEDEKSLFIKILLNLYSSEDINSLVSIIIENFDKFSSSNSIENEELIFILLDILNKNDKKELSVNYENVFDERLIPNIYILDNIRNSIEDNDDNKFLIYSIISINNKQWLEIHPDHLKLILNGYLNYNNGALIKDLIIEVFKSYKIL